MTRTTALIPLLALGLLLILWGEWRALFKLAGVAFAFSGFMVGHAVHTSMV